MKKKIQSFLDGQRRKLVILWSKVAKAYLDFKENPSVKAFLKFVTWLLMLAIKAKLKSLITKLLELWLIK